MRLRLWACLALLLGMFLLDEALAARDMGDNPHAFGPGDCRGCHVTNPAKLRLNRGEKMRMVAPVRQLCSRCHWEITENYSHPVEVIPTSAEIPEDLPLAWNGRMTCSTCHDIHGARKTGLGQRSFYLRRPTRGKEFCLVCHPKNPVQTLASRGSHKGAMTYAHTAKYTIQNPGIGIDSMSVECLTCHDGSGAVGVQTTIVGAGVWKHSGDGQSPHPIGVNYSLAQARSRKLVPETMLNKSLKLFNGMIGCGTCHNPYSKKDLKLTVERKELCTSCHLH